MVKLFILSSFCPLRLRNSNFHTYFTLCFPHSCFISPVTTLFPFTLSLLPQVLWSFSHLLLPLCGSLTWFSQRPSHTLGFYWTASDVLLMRPLLYSFWGSGWGVGYRKVEHRGPVSCCQSPMGILRLL